MVKKHILELPEIKYSPTIIKLPHDKNSILDTLFDVSFSTNIDYPREEYGFNHYLHANKNKTYLYEKFEGKKKVYNVINRFERYVDNYEKSINDETAPYFALKNANIGGLGFYKLWEILVLMNVIDINNDKFTSAHIMENNGSFIQSVMMYRSKFCGKHNKHDKYYSITLPKEYSGDKYETKIDKTITGYNDINVINTFNKSLDDKMSEKIELITSNLDYSWINTNVREQECYKLLLAEIFIAMKIQKKGGVFICKIFETFTKVSLKIISILTQLYENVYVIKPLISRLENSEKFIVCTNFKYDDKNSEYKKIFSKMEHLMDLIKNKNRIVDIFSEYVINKNFVDSMIQSNRVLANNQFKIINEIISFIKGDIYSGDVYHTKRDEQIEGTMYWLNLYFIDSLNDAKELYKSIIMSQLNINNSEIVELEKSLVPVLGRY